MTLIIYFFLAPLVAGILLILNVLLATHRPDAEKDGAYECGFTGLLGQTRSAFPIQYYLVAVLFTIFDVEILLWTPIGVTLQSVDLYGFWVAVCFFLVLTLGFVYELSKGVLYFTDQRSAISSPAEIQ